MSASKYWRSKFKESSSPIPSESPKESAETERTVTEKAPEEIAPASRPAPIGRDFSRNKVIKQAGPDGRPMPPQRIPSVQTRYMDMLLAQDTIPRLHNILCALFQWILLAGYLVLPATFTRIEESDDVQDSADGGNVAASAALATVQNLPLLYVGAFCAGIGLLGKAWLWFAHRLNYVWLVNKIFM